MNKQTDFYADNDTTQHSKDTEISNNVDESQNLVCNEQSLMQQSTGIPIPFIALDFLQIEGLWQPWFEQVYLASFLQKTQMMVSIFTLSIYVVFFRHNIVAYLIDYSIEYT